VDAIEPGLSEERRPARANCRAFGQSREREPRTHPKAMFPATAGACAGSEG
jgi:hypothetical protein